MSKIQVWADYIEEQGDSYTANILRQNNTISFHAYSGIHSDQHWHCRIKKSEIISLIFVANNRVLLKFKTNYLNTGSKSKYMKVEDAIKLLPEFFTEEELNENKVIDPT